MSARRESRALARGIRDYPGMWIAIKDDEIIEMGQTPDEVVMRLHQREIKGAAVVRMPSEHDPELVGLG